MKKGFYPLTILTVFLTISPHAMGIVNIESLRTQYEKIGITTSISASFEGKQGNSNTEEYKFGAHFVYNQNGAQQLLFANAKYGESGQIKNANKTTLHYRYVFQPQEKFAQEVYGQLEQDEFTRLNSRWLVGGGLRLKTLANEQTSLFVGLGAFYSEETLDKSFANTEDLHQSFWRWNSYLSFSLTVTDFTKFLSVLYYQPDVTAIKDFRRLWENGIELSLGKNFSVSLVYTQAHDSQPPQGVKATDHQYNTVWKWTSH